MSHRSAQKSRAAENRAAVVEKYLAAKGQPRSLTQRAFCQREGLGYTTFQSWLQKYRSAHRQTSAPVRRGFIPIRLQPPTVAALPATSCALEFPNGVVVHLAGPLDPQLLSYLIHTAGEKS